MSAKQKMCTVMDLPTSVLASLFAPLMFAGLPNHFPLLTMIQGVWIADETLSRVFDIFSQLKQKLRSKQTNTVKT